jgi:hypothetical protein
MHVKESFLYMDSRPKQGKKERKGVKKEIVPYAAKHCKA